MKNLAHYPCNCAAVLALAPALVVATWQATPAAEPVPRPNVVIILTDDQGTLDAGCFGSTDLDTPAIDALAERGVRFTQAYSHTTIRSRSTAI